MKTSHNVSNTRFLYEKFSGENEPQKPQNLDKMFKKISSLKCRPAIFKITWFLPSALKKLQNWVNFSIFSCLKFISVVIINNSTILLNNYGKIKRWTRRFMWVACCFKQVSKQLLKKIRQKLRKILRKLQPSFQHCVQKIEAQAKNGFLIKKYT